MGKNILVVDNNPVMSKLMADFLVNQGHKVLVAEDGIEALDILETFIPDVMFIDLIMPRISGDKLCRIIQSNPLHKDIFLVVVTATAAEEKDDIEKIGAHAYIAKSPFKSMAKHISTILAQSDQRDSHGLPKEILGIEEIYPRQVTKELIATNRHKEVIFDKMSEGVIEFTQKKKIIYANAATLSLLNISEEMLLATNFIDIFSGDQRDQLQLFLEYTNSTKTQTHQKLQFVINQRRVELRIFPIQDSTHESFAAIIYDVTDRILAEEALKENERYLQSLMNTMLAGLIVIDAETHIIIDANISAAELFGAPKENIIGKKCHKFICSKEEKHCPITDLGKKIDKSERTILNIKGDEIPVLKSVSSVEIGKHKYLIETFIDITERKKMEAKLHEASITDELTGLLNRRGFFAMADNIFHNAARSNCVLYVIYFDLNGLKLINDTLGHHAGDQALAETAAILKNTFRKADVIGRVGGDEFVILYTDKSGSNNYQPLLDRLEENLKYINDHDKREFSISLSIGCAQYNPAQPISLEELIRLADEQMYKNKKRHI